MIKSTDIERQSSSYPFSNTFRGRGGIHMEIKDLFDYSLNLLHDPMQEGLRVYFIGLACNLLNKNKDESNKRTVQNAGQQEDDSQGK